MESIAIGFLLVEPLTCVDMCQQFDKKKGDISIVMAYVAVDEWKKYTNNQIGMISK